MNILTHAVHTGYQHLLSKTGHQFFSVSIPGSQETFWNTRSRPLPPNFHRVRHWENPGINFDLILVHFDLGYHYFKGLPLPMVYKEHCVRKRFQPDEHFLKRVSRISFASKTAADRWELPDDMGSKKVIIGMGIDTADFGITRPKKNLGARKVLVVAQNVNLRGNEKGRDTIQQLSETMPLSLVGSGNEGLGGSVGEAASYEHLIELYRSAAVFANPCETLGMSTLEAMAAGLPVVTFKTVNSDLIRNGENGFVVDSVAEAQRAIKMLLNNPDLACRLGATGKELIRTNFKMQPFVDRWNRLFDDTVATLSPDQPICEPISTHPLEKALEQILTTTTFHYCRVGHDAREMTFLANGRVGVGADTCELLWKIKSREGQHFLEILSLGFVTCSLKHDGQNHWSGVWNYFERMPISLTPA